MITSKYGKELTIEVTGASHAPQIEIVMHGVPKGQKVDLNRIQEFLDRRKGGQNAYSTKRAEADKPDVLSGLTETPDGFVTTGEALKAVFYNQNTRSSDYEQMKYVPRPSHADYTSYMKYGDGLDRSGGGMFSPGSGQRLYSGRIRTGSNVSSRLGGEKRRPAGSAISRTRGRP